MWDVSSQNVVISRDIKIEELGQREHNEYTVLEDVPSDTSHTEGEISHHAPEEISAGEDSDNSNLIISSSTEVAGEYVSDTTPPELEQVSETVQSSRYRRKPRE